MKLWRLIVKTNCWDCKNLQKSIHMVLEDNTLYNCWCEVGNIEDEKCDEFEEDKNE